MALGRGAAHKQGMSDNFNPALHLRGKDQPNGEPASDNLGGFAKMKPNTEAPTAVTDQLTVEVPPAPRIIARFQPQQWRNDYAVDDDAHGPVLFDVTDMVNRMPAAERLRLTDNSDASDELWQAAVAGGIVSKYAGTGYVDVEQAITDYDDEMRSRSAGDEDELPSTYIGREMDADRWTLAAWDVFAARRSVAAAADGQVDRESLHAFEAELFGAYTTEYELDEAWDNYRTADTAPLSDSLTVERTTEGIAAFWN